MVGNSKTKCDSRLYSALKTTPYKSIKAQTFPVLPLLQVCQSYKIRDKLTFLKTRSHGLMSEINLPLDIKSLEIISQSFDKK